MPCNAPYNALHVTTVMPKESIMH